MANSDLPATQAIAVTPSDTVLIYPSGDRGVTRGVYVGAGGDVSVLMGVGNGNTVVFAAVAAGSLLPICVSRVNSTGTTAGSILALR